MKLFQILLPLRDNQGHSFPLKFFSDIKEELAKKFGGMTAFTQSPATGLWEDSEDHVIKDQIVIFEVMAKNLELEWWETYRKLLEQRFRQDRIIIKVFTIDIV